MTRPAPSFLTGDRVLVVSPHLDDVPLSCAALVERTSPLTVLEVCTAGPVPAVVGDWDLRSGFADSEAAMSARRDEERAAFAGTPHEFVDLGLLDAQYSGGPDDVFRGRVRDAVVAWIDAVAGACTVVLPVATGCAPGAKVPLARLRNQFTGDQLFWVHPDHVAVRDACVDALLARPEAGVAVYEDYPYRLTVRGDRAAREVARRLGARARPERVDVAIDRDAKARRLGAYATQLPLLLPPAALAPGALARRLPTTERYWRVARG